jgi:hypothetical protein
MGDRLWRWWRQLPQSGQVAVAGLAGLLLAWLVRTIF